jgi:hypothetical protein
LVLTEWGGRLLRQQGIPVEFEKREQPQVDAARPGDDGGTAPQEPDRSDNATRNKTRKEEILARADNLTILSRLGSEYVLRFQEGGTRMRTFVLPKEEVVSWSTISEESEARRKPPTTSRPPS